ncbi:MAG: GNAT family N-acetyltransferase [Rhodocyclales bacterium]|nr:GNAT family N-acetyltransferase [Rhodocyclales bacterium]
MYFVRGFQTALVSYSGKQSPFPRLIAIWADGSLVGYVMTFLPSRSRLPFLFGQRVREITYAVEAPFQGHGFGTWLVKLAVEDSRRDDADIVGLIRPSNGPSLRIFRKFNSQDTIVRRTHRNWWTTYAISLSPDQHKALDFDKHEERNRYDLSARASGETSQPMELDDAEFGARLVSPTLRTPYFFYEARLSALIGVGVRVLELGAGTGANTLVPLKLGAQVTALDISHESLKVLRRRFSVGGFSAQASVGDIEALPVSSSTFDVVVSAGSLSYGENRKVMVEVIRVLRPGGVFVCVDSLNDNMIYRVNRYIHFLRGRRSRSTLKNMPSMRLIELYRANFEDVEVEYFGAISFMAGILEGLFGADRAREISDSVDRAVGVKRSAFKFVLVAKKRVDDGRKR